MSKEGNKWEQEAPLFLNKITLSPTLYVKDFRQRHITFLPVNYKKYLSAAAVASSRKDNAKCNFENNCLNSALYNYSYCAYKKAKSPTISTENISIESKNPTRLQLMRSFDTLTTSGFYRASPSEEPDKRTLICCKTPALKLKYKTSEIHPILKRPKHLWSPSYDSEAYCRGKWKKNKSRVDMSRQLGRERGSYMGNAAAEKKSLKPEVILPQSLAALCKIQSHKILNIIPKGYSKDNVMLDLHHRKQEALKIFHRTRIKTTSLIS